VFALARTASLVLARTAGLQGPIPKGIYALGGKVAHSCLPNCMVNCCNPRGFLTLTATYPIVAGDFVTIARIYPTLSVNTRCAAIAAEMGVVCACVRCTSADACSAIRCVRPGCTGAVCPVLVVPGAADITREALQGRFEVDIVCGVCGVADVALGRATYERTQVVMRLVKDLEDLQQRLQRGFSLPHVSCCVSSAAVTSDVARALV
jgi:hypothetical protein